MQNNELAKWTNRYPRMAPAIRDVTALVGRLRETPARNRSRLSRRPKRASNSAAGVSRETSDRIIDMMQSSSHVTGDSEWEEEQDFFFEGADGEIHRTRVHYDSDEMLVKPHTVKKHDMGTHTLAVRRDDGTPVGCDIRVSLKMEEPILRIQTCVSTTLVRIKQRRRFVTSDGMWSFDFAMLWKGRTKTEAEQEQASKDPSFEVECELVDAPKALALHSDARIATSLLLKMCDLLPAGATTDLPRVETVGATRCAPPPAGPVAA